MRAKPYPVIRLTSWEQFLRTISESRYSNWAFRGQRKSAWPLESALSRYFREFSVQPDAWADQEDRILRIFKRKAHQYLNHPPPTDDDLEWLALMQHHGAPTRLLDFTWSPYVAAFFALESARTEGAIWAVNPARFSSSRNKSQSKVDPRMKDVYRKVYQNGKRRVLWMGEPHPMNRRLIAQSGTFVMPGILNEPLDRILSETPEPEDAIAKLVLPAEKMRETGMRELYRMNITYAQLFPDLEGLARSLGYELEFHWAYNPRTKEPLV